MGKTLQNIVTAASSVNEKAPAPTAATIAALLCGNAASRLPHLEVTILLATAIGKRRESVLAHPELAVPADAVAVFDDLVQRRIAGVPIAYLTGTREFYGIELEVTPEVLIPRPDTELLVDAALARTSASAPVAILDLGTGTGAIAIAIALNRPRASVEAVDVSDGAVVVAAANAARHRIASIDVHVANWFDGVRRARFDLIVSNPPYIRDRDPHLERGDVRFEPRDALVSGADGLAAIRMIVAGARARLAAGGYLLIEHGYDQGPACRALFAGAGFESVATLVDLGGNDRVCVGQNR